MKRRCAPRMFMYTLHVYKPGNKAKDLSMFLVEKGMPGFRLGQQIEDKLGMRASMTAELVFDDCKVTNAAPLSCLLVLAI